jgi:hypothetical protein
MFEVWHNMKYQRIPSLDLLEEVQSCISFLLISYVLMFIFLYERLKFCPLIPLNAFVKIALHIEMQNEN